ncbi:uridine diphosphate-N-acetylglucosamine-binding protein YvcK [Catellatospora sp. KI3]|uniref:gluconeogenesis factor YvcK family protein n=1 Tax=Catellatospora sp. KI3 TaxID=3041620 RepID=UPI0024826306|nr:uridine diphosphate-N-acetylglucosamine-binding protein YvcK [Catellatospora sp. KI3]MDI1465459.1 uridine diphosphate-N-acetylglucosamine-binding protein YvcK [Catellatospora sp. KI3]
MNEATKPIKVVAFGGGHGLSASLRALRATGLPLDLTAVVTVADDGGSSGRLRAARSVLPPGDLRQALAALAADDGVSDGTAKLMQYRFTGSDELAGHPVGNVVLCGLMELLGDPVAALEHAQAMVHAVGRVLPMSCHPLGIEADLLVDGEKVTVRGQHQVAVAPGRVLEVRLEPPYPQPCPQAIEAIGAADWLVFGPGSWYTSVIPHLLVPEQAAAITASPARRLVTLNLAADRETVGLSLPDHLAALSRYLPDLKVDIVLVDRNAVPDPEPVANAAESLGARIALAPVAVDDGTPRHDPVRLGRALVPLLGTAR